MTPFRATGAQNNTAIVKFESYGAMKHREDVLVHEGMRPVYSSSAFRSSFVVRRCDDSSWVETIHWQRVDLPVTCLGCIGARHAKT